MNEDEIVYPEVIEFLHLFNNMTFEEITIMLQGCYEISDTPKAYLALSEMYHRGIQSALFQRHIKVSLN